MSLGDIDRAMEGLGQQFNDLLRKAADANNADNYTAQFQSISTAMAEFKRRKAMILQTRQEQEQTNRRVQAVASVLKTASSELTEWDDNVIYQLLEKVTVLSRERIRVTLRDGLEIEQAVEQPKGGSSHDLCDWRLSRKLPALPAGIFPGASWDDEERYGHHRRRLRRRVVWRQPRR